MLLLNAMYAPIMYIICHTVIILLCGVAVTSYNYMRRDAPHWLAVQRASWAHPHGPDSSFGLKALQHPVVQVSHNDAKAYCKHVGQ